MPTKIISTWTNIRLEELRSIAKEIWTLLPEASLVALDAEMGSGKTTLVSALLQEAQITHFEGSPTFAIVQAYQSPSKGPIYHLDCYRIENENELLNLGLEELFDSSAYFFIEWPQKIDTILPKPHFRLYIRIESDLSREITLHYDY
jgi:tRNA threonylcarbamoyladenosine biosynthesis protein TsaE